MSEYRLTVQKQVEACCEECGEIAVWQLTFLLNGGRNNPASKAYGEDDCSWCSDLEIFSCTDCERKLRDNPPEGYRWCSAFQKDRFTHLFLSWEKDEKLTAAWQDLLTAAIEAADGPTDLDELNAAVARGEM